MHAYVPCFSLLTWAEHKTGLWVIKSKLLVIISIRSHRYEIYPWWHNVFSLSLSPFHVSTELPLENITVFIFYHFPTPKWQGLLQSLLTEDKTSPIQPNQYHGCWWTGDARSQGISGYSIDLILRGYFKLITKIINIGHVSTSVSVRISIIPGMPTFAEFILSLALPFRRDIN